MARKENISIKFGLVNYRDIRFPNIVDGKWILDNTFTKDIRFEKQSEFRIELFKHCDKAMVLNIGNINDISYITDCDTLIAGFDIIQTV